MTTVIETTGTVGLASEVYFSRYIPAAADFWPNGVRKFTEAEKAFSDAIARELFARLERRGSADPSLPLIDPDESFVQELRARYLHADGGTKI